VTLDLSGAFCFLLPQTAIRTWGIDSFRPTELVQYEYVFRRKFDENVVPTIYELNRLILGINLPNQSVAMRSTNLIEKNNLNDCYVDCHLLNLDKYYGIKDFSHNMKIIDYSTLGHRSLLLSDARFPKDFLRACKRNIIFMKKFHPTEIYQWDDVASRQKSKLGFGWSNIFISTDRIQRSAKKFLLAYTGYFPELQDVNPDHRVILILPHNYDGVESVTQHITRILHKDPKNAENFRNADHIILKQHRTSLVPYPDEFIIFGKRVRVLKSIQSRLLPAEILTLGFQNIDLYSGGSSVIFSNSAIRYNLLETYAATDLKNYGLMYKRNQIKFPGPPKNEPDGIL
jgi:hypothetical protein